MASKNLKHVANLLLISVHIRVSSRFQVTLKFAIKVDTFRAISRYLFLWDSGHCFFHLLSVYIDGATSDILRKSLTVSFDAFLFLH